MKNSQLADLFEQLADLLEFQGANAFRTRAYRNGARAIRDLPESISSIVEDDPKRLQTIDGIGKSVAEKCVTLVRTGELPQLTEVLEQVPESVLALLRIPGLGPKKAAVLFRELQIQSLEQLQAACEAGQVEQLKGFGAKTQESILAGIAIASAAGERILWAEADAVVGELREHMATCSAIEQLDFAGSYRRGRETVGDLDILVVSQQVDQVMDHLATFASLKTVIVRGGTKMSIRLDSGLQVDLRVVPQESFGAALQYFTGSKDHNVVVRGLAKQRGLKINEWGVFRVDGDEEAYLAGHTEADVYAALELPVFPPELRESRREFELAEAGELPHLIQESDIVGDLHMHTTETDGKASLEEMVAAAQQRGLQYIAITDHSQRVSMANGLDPKRLRQQWQQIDELNTSMGDTFTVLKGIECDILEKGGMDLPDDVLAEADWVLASIHYGQNQPRAQITDRILGALEHPHVSAIAHPTGRLINRREAYDVDMDAMFQAAKQHRKLLELNANPVRLDLNDVYCAAARQHEIPLVINTDAHSEPGLDVMRYGVLQARRGGLGPQDVANTRSWDEIRSWLQRGSSV